MAEYIVKVNSSNFIEIFSGQQKFLILSAQRDPIIGDTLIIVDRSSPDKKIKSIITNFDMEINGIEDGFVIVSIDTNINNQDIIQRQAEVNNQIVLLTEKNKTLSKQKKQVEDEQKRLLVDYENLKKECSTIDKTKNENDEDNTKLAEKYNMLCQSYNELDDSKTKLEKQLNNTFKNIESLQNEISLLKTENFQQKNELSRRHNLIEDFKFKASKSNDEKAMYIKRIEEFANLNSSLNQEINKLKNNENVIATPLTLPNDYIQLKTLTKNLLSYIDSNL